jgi:hypothetical protein
MSRRFVQHVESAGEHLQIALDNLLTQDWEEAVVSLRCFVEQLREAESMASTTEARELLAQFSTAARLGEVSIQRATDGRRASSSHGDEGLR